MNGTSSTSSETYETLAHCQVITASWLVNHATEKAVDSIWSALSGQQRKTLIVTFCSSFLKVVSNDQKENKHKYVKYVNQYKNALINAISSHSDKFEIFQTINSYASTITAKSEDGDKHQWIMFHVPHETLDYGTTFLDQKDQIHLKMTNMYCFYVINNYIPARLVLSLKNIDRFIDEKMYFISSKTNDIIMKELQSSQFNTILRARCNKNEFFKLSVIESQLDYDYSREHNTKASALQFLESYYSWSNKSKETRNDLEKINKFEWVLKNSFWLNFDAAVELANGDRKNSKNNSNDKNKKTGRCTIPSIGDARHVSVNKLADLLPRLQYLSIIDKCGDIDKNNTQDIKHHENVLKQISRLVINQQYVHQLQQLELDVKRLNLISMPWAQEISRCSKLQLSSMFKQRIVELTHPIFLIRQMSNLTWLKLHIGIRNNLIIDSFCKLCKVFGNDKNSLQLQHLDLSFHVSCDVKPVWIDSIKCAMLYIMGLIVADKLWYLSFGWKTSGLGGKIKMISDRGRIKNFGKRILHKLNRKFANSLKELKISTPHSVRCSDFITDAAKTKLVFSNVYRFEFNTFCIKYSSHECDGTMEDTIESVKCDFFGMFPNANLSYVLYLVYVWKMWEMLQLYDLCFLFRCFRCINVNRFIR